MSFSIFTKEMDFKLIKEFVDEKSAEFHILSKYIYK